MANGDMQARLLLDSKDFDKKIDKSKKQVKGLGKEADKAGKGGGKSIGGISDSLGKMISLAAIASAAMKTLQTGITGSQSLTDEWGRTMHSLKAIWEEFAHSIMTWDWSAWENGFGGITAKAEALYDAVDKLNNVQISAGFVQKEQQSIAKAAQTAARNTDLSAMERAAHLATSERAAEAILEAAAMEEEETLQAVYALIKSQNLPAGFPIEYITEEDILDAIRYHASHAAARKIGDYTEFPWKVAAVMYKAAEEVEEKENEYSALEDSLYTTWTPTHDRKVTYVNGSLETEWVETGGYSHDSEFRKKYGHLPEEEYEKLAEEAYERLGEISNEISDIKEEEKAKLKALSGTAAGWALLEKLTDEELKQLVGWYNAIIDARNMANEINNTNQELRRTIRQALASETALFDPLAADKMAGISFSNNVPEWRRWGKNAIAQHYDATVNPAADIPSTIKALDAQKMSNTLFDNELLKIAKENREALDGWAQGVGLLSDAFGRLGASIGGTTGEMLTFIGTILDATQQMLPLIAQIMAEKAARDANATSAATEAAAKTLSAHAGIPFAGVALGVAAVGAIIAAIQSVPKFAEGGIVNRATLGIFGEAGPEAVMPLDKLEEYVTPRELRVTGDIKASGKELKVVLDNYSRVRNG